MYNFIYGLGLVMFTPLHVHRRTRVNIYITPSPRQTRQSMHDTLRFFCFIKNIANHISSELDYASSRNITRYESVIFSISNAPLANANDGKIFILKSIFKSGAVGFNLHN